MTRNKIISYLLLYFLGVIIANVFSALVFNSPTVITWFMVAFCISWGFILGYLKDKELKNEDKNKSKKP